MLTELGNFLRKLRLDKQMRLKGMAEQLGYTPAFLSAVELGRKTPPTGFADRIITALGLAPDQARRVQELCNIKPVKLTPHTLEQSYFLEGLARGLDTLTDEQVAGLKRILRGSEHEPNS